MTVNCSKVDIDKGSKGDDVLELQKYMTYFGYYSGAQNSLAGDLTVAAIKKLQKDLGVTVDGNFGPKTCNASCINGCDISNTSLTIELVTWKDMMARYDAFVEANGRTPSISYVDKENPYQYVTNAKYVDILERYEAFIVANGREPNYVNVTAPSSSSSSSTTSSSSTSFTSSPHWTSTGCNKLGQCNSYYCGPHSLHQVLRKFGITDISESTLAGWMGTTTSGTGHDGINTAIKKVASNKGISLSYEWMYFSDLGSSTSERFKALGEKISSSNVDAIIHNKYRNQYGHYEVCRIINTKDSTVQVLNSLGSKCSSPAYCGYLETRSFSTFAGYIANTTGGQKSVCLITKN